MLVITLSGKNLQSRFYWQLNTRGLKTITLSRAVLPLVNFNVSDKLGNNRVPYMTGEKDGRQLKVFHLTIRNGLYTVESLNDEIQRAMVRGGARAGFVTLSYVEARGRVGLVVKKPYMVYVDRLLGELLGFPEGYYPSLHGKDVDVRGVEECKFTRHSQYIITCNLVDKRGNLLNGKPSDILAVLQPKAGEYGDVMEYTYGLSVPVLEGEFSEVIIKIYNQDMEEIQFSEPVRIILRLE